MDCLIYIKVKAFLKFGENLKVVGNVPELGNWDFTKGLDLITTSQSYPYWSL